jgi:hypothetical protein
MNLRPLGELRRDDSIGEWLVSDPIEIPLLGVRLPVVLEGLATDPSPGDFADAVTRFLALTTIDRSVATPHVYESYRELVESVDDPDLEGIRIDSPEDVWAHVHPTDIHVSRRHRHDKMVYVQVAADCDWELEHGLQLVYRGGWQLTRVSDQDGHLTYADAFDLPEEQDRIR